VPGGPVYTYEQTLADPHVKARRMIHDIDHPKIGPMKTLGLPIKSGGQLTEIRKPAPLLGQHSREILSELGYDGGAIDSLLESRAVKAAA
jgi:formyl-CoA transferase